jgi:hypothetical protein
MAAVFVDGAPVPVNGFAADRMPTGLAALIRRCQAVYPEEPNPSGVVPLEFWCVQISWLNLKVLCCF